MAETKAAPAKQPETQADARIQDAKEAAEREAARIEAEREESLRAIEARAEDKPDGEKVHGMWVQYINPNRDDPDFETMDGYTFERDGDAIMVKVTADRAAKFRTNRNFHVVEELADSSKVPDGATKDVPTTHRPRGKPRVGRTG